MALSEVMLDLLWDKLRPGQAIASMGYPDIICPLGKVKERLGENAELLEYREDSKAICKRHGLANQKIPDSESLFELLGCTLDVFDIVQERGSEIVVDLNVPIPANAREQFDFVLDVGTLEHCFNAPQALMNMASMAKVGGFVMHENPFNWGNHGFWNLNPTLFHDFYEDNGFEAVSCWLSPRGSSKIHQAPWTDRFQFTNNGEANLITVAKRLEVREFAFPTQTKYRKALG
jgi:hypothetical protein